MERAAFAESLEFLDQRERFLPVKADAILCRILQSPELADGHHEKLRLFLQMIRGVSISNSSTASTNSSVSTIPSIPIAIRFRCES